MVATVLAAPFEYTALKHLTVYVCPAFADPSAPTRTELNAGKDVTRHISKQGITGFTKSAKTVEADNLKTGGSVTLDDGYSLDASSIQFWLSKNGPTTDIRSVLAEGDEKYIVFFDNKDIAANLMDVWPILVQTISKSKQGGQGMMLNVSFQTNTPFENLAVPA